MMSAKSVKLVSGRRRRRTARIAALGAVMVAGLGSAHAADVAESFLRGAFAPPTEFKAYNNWEGPYIGVDLCRSFMSADMSDSASSLIENMLRNATVQDQGNISSWPSLNGSASGNVWGGFVGYNWQQLSGIVLGIEGGYHMMSGDFSAVDKDNIRRVINLNGTNNDVTIKSGSRFTIKDYATMRGRVGYVMGQFLPYAGLGVSVARVSYHTHVSVGVSQNNGPTIPFNSVIDKDNAVAYGANLSLGADVILLPNLFLRGEWEYIAFAKVEGIRADMNTFRVGLGLKF
jgi:opacity protein-like surface antigen